MPDSATSIGFSLPDLTQKLVSCPSDALSLLKRGASTRSTGATAQNATSSRSHAVFRITADSADGLRRTRWRANNLFWMDECNPRSSL